MQQCHIPEVVQRQCEPVPRPGNKSGARWRRFAALVFLSATAGTAPEAAQSQDVSLTGPADATVGSEVSVAFEGNAKPTDFITIVVAGTPEGKYEAYQYARSSPVKLIAPHLPGDYEIRYLDAAAPYPTRTSRAIKVVDVTAELEAPDAVDAGAKVEVTWKGPNNDRDFISIVEAGAAEGTYRTGYVYTQRGSPVVMEAPDVAGDYELRYLMGASPYRTLGRRPITIRGTGASITAPESVSAGAKFSFTWQGPDNDRDFITIVPAGAADNSYDAYVYTRQGSPAELTAPEDPGPHEVRYLTGQTYSLLAKAPIEVTPVAAGVSGPTAVEARSVAIVTWEGPGNALDFVTIVPAGSVAGTSGNYAYTSRGAELRIQTPLEPGEYEYRYVTGGKNRNLASQSVTVTPSAIPGSLRVVDGTHKTTSVETASLEGASVVVVLDASGSMLQRIGNETRIAIAKAAVTRLLQQELPDNVRFSLRVYGHKEADSCRSDVEILLGPFNRAQAVAKVASVNAMNLAKTPIGASLAKVATDLASVPGPHLVILLTDGEETCDGDAGSVIKEMVASGMDVRVNIVGFAIDELMLRETFQSWATLGNGLYLDAQNAEELSIGLAQAIELPFEVLDSTGAVVGQGTVNGPAIELMPGDYSVRTSSSGSVRSIKVVADEMSVVTLGEG